MFKARVNSCDGIYDSMDVRFTKSCDNNCSFCIEKDGLESLGKTDVDELIKNTINSGIKDILILGGEPFLLPKKLLQYISGIREYADSIYITTSLPKTMSKHWDETKEILSLIDGLNVSLHNSDYLLNNLILHASKMGWNRVEFLKELLKERPEIIRVSVNLTLHGVNSNFRLMKYLSDLESMGCQHVKINELQNADDEYVNFEKITGIKLPSPYSFGCQTPIKGLTKNMKVTLKRSCFLVSNKVNASLWDLGKVIYKSVFKPKVTNRFAVMYENGKVGNRWEKAYEGDKNETNVIN